MTVLIAIHHRKGSYSERWQEYCREHGISFRVVNCYASDIMQQLSGVKGLLWHWHHTLPGDVLIARNLIRAVEMMGLKVYPNINTCWHYDDKIAQKYLLEAVGAPVVPTYVFYNQHDALAWCNQASFPKVFKLRKGAGAQNVKLVHTASEARSLILKAFNQGFKPVPGYFRDFETKLGKTHLYTELGGKLRRLPKSLFTIYQANKLMGRERGYVYFQDFIADNQYDTRVVIIGKRAFAYMRIVRPGDFRASGAGKFEFDRDKLNTACIRVAFDVAQKLGAQSLAFDFVTEGKKEPLLIEISYSFGTVGLKQCSGYFDDALTWHEETLLPEDAILKDFLNEF